MPDYSAILRRSIESLPDNTPAMRQAVYDRARAALARQLTAVDPPLSADDLEAQHQRLEDAIADLESAIIRGEDPALAGIDWDAIDSEFAGFDEAVKTSEEEFAHEDLEAHSGQHQNVPPLAPHPGMEPDPLAGDALRAEPRGARFSPDPQQPYAQEREMPRPAPEQKPSKAPLYIFLSLLILVVGGAGAIAFTQWGTVQSIAENMLAGSVPARDDPAGTTSEPPRPFAEGEGEQSQTVASMAPDSQAPDGENGKSEDRLIDSNGNISSVDNDGTTTAMIPAAPSDTAPGEVSNLVGQKAIFYEQGDNGAPGQAREGVVAWSRFDQPDGSPAIEAVLDIPEKSMSAKILITRNLDSGLPASHLIEINFNGADGLSASEIESVPALVMKPNERARGQPLTGAAVPVTENLFWIALSNDPEQVDRNITLMRDGAWFDMPLIFKDGTRALITFEKGIPGDQVFETVLASWSPTQ